MVYKCLKIFKKERSFEDWPTLVHRSAWSVVEGLNFLLSTEMEYSSWSIDGWWMVKISRAGGILEHALVVVGNAIIAAHWVHHLVAGCDSAGCVKAK